MNDRDQPDETPEAFDDLLGADPGAALIQATNEVDPKQILHFVTTIKNAEMQVGEHAPIRQYRGRADDCGAWSGWNPTDRFGGFGSGEDVTGQRDSSSGPARATRARALLWLSLPRETKNQND